MFEFTKGQESVFEIFDELIDNGTDVWDEVQSNEALRKRINRNFECVEGRTKTESALFLYGFIDFKYIPSSLELKRCWIVNNSGVELNQNEVRHLQSVCNLEFDEVLSMAREFKDEAIAEYVFDALSRTEPTRVKYSLIRDEFPSFVRHFLEVNKVTMVDIRRFLGIDFEMILYEYPNHLDLCALGREFEHLLGKYVFKESDKQVLIDDCRPDFISEGRWIDAKLSRSTAFDSRCKTVEKYLGKTDKLTIVYAVDDEHPRYPDNNVDFVHVSEFYSSLHQDAIDEFENLISRAGNIKGISL